VAICSGFGDQKIGYREEDVQHWFRRFRMVAGTGRTTENERWPKMENDGGRRWRTTVTSRAWWSTVGRK